MTGELLVKLDKKGLTQFWQYLTSNEMLFMFQISTSHMMIWQRITKMMKTLPWPALWNQRWVLWIPFLLLGILSGEATLPLSYLPLVSLAVVTKLVSLWKKWCRSMASIHVSDLAQTLGNIFDLVAKWGFVRSHLV